MEDNQTQGVTQTDQGESQADLTPTAETEQPQGQPESPEAGQPDASQDQGADKTDRGTNKAKEPESQYYQQQANQLADMRALLSDPVALKEYLRMMEGTQAPQAGEEDDLSDVAEKVLTPDGQLDPVKFVQFMEERLIKKIEQGVKHQTENSMRAHKLGQAYDSDKASIRGEHPELDPKHQSFDPELEQFVGERFIAQGGLEGKVTLRQVVDQTYAYLAKVKGKGQQAAQTEIIKKKAGAIQTSTVPGETQETGDQDASPAQILASRVQKQVSARRS